jgi:hypothetical protein
MTPVYASAFLKIEREKEREERGDESRKFTLCLLSRPRNEASVGHGAESAFPSFRKDFS